MFKTWNFLSQIGVTHTDSHAAATKVILLNRLNILVSFIYLIIGVMYFVFDDYSTAFYLVGLMVLNAIAFVMHKKQFRLFSQSLFLITSYLSIFYFDSYAGLKAGAWLYYVPIIMSLFFLFDVKNDKPILLFHISIILLLFCVNYFTDYYLFHSEIITTVMKSNLFLANSIFSISSVLFFVYLFLAKNTAAEN
jgi:hypothetical protein